MCNIELSRNNSARWALIIFGILILPTTTAIWCIPWFITQDSSSHLYNAYIISELLRGNSFVQNFYVLNWKSLPNLLGHLFLVGLMQIVSIRTADRIVMTLTSVGLASAVLWLRWRIAGWKGIALLVPLAVSLALNILWLWGFYNFLLGACLFPVTMGYWWVSREQRGGARAVILAGLLVLGYVCHLASAILTIFGLLILALMTPGQGYLARCRWTAISLIPLLPLGILYHGLMQTGGEVRPLWTSLPQDHWSFYGWFAYLESNDPFNFISPIFNPRILPFIEGDSPWFKLFYPPYLISVSIVALAVGSVSTRTNQHAVDLRVYRGWIILAFLLLIGWAVAPYSLGGHGGYLRVRFLPFALIAIIPVLKLDCKHWSVWISAIALTIAVTVQSAAIWNYALNSNRLARVFAEALPYLGTGKRVGALMIDPPRWGRIYPIIHVNNLFGIGTGNIVWNNYEASVYFFPVQYRNEPDRYIGQEFTRLETFNLSEQAVNRYLNRWAQLLGEHHSKIDVLVMWGTDLRVDDITTQWYGPEPVFRRDNLRIFQRRGVQRGQLGTTSSDTDVQIR